MLRRIFLIAVSALFLFSSVSCFAESMPCKGKHKEMLKEKIDKVKAKLEEMTKQLSLTPEQQAKIREILTKSHEDIKKIFEDVKKQVKDIRIKANEQIKALLIPEQKEKFKETRKSHEVAPKVEE